MRRCEPAIGTTDTGLSLAFAIAATLSCPFVDNTLGQEPPHYRVIDLGTMSGQSNSLVALAVNDRRQAVGWIDEAGFGGTVGFFWDDGVFFDLEGSSEFTEGQDVNGSGIVSGATHPLLPSFSPGGVPFAWSVEGGQVDLGLRGFYATAKGINDAGVIVCSYTRPDSIFDGGPHIAYVWEDGVLTHLPDLVDEHATAPHAINNGGVIVGESYSEPDMHAVYWDAEGVVHLLPPLFPEEVSSRAVDLNDRGEVVGGIRPTRTTSHAVYWDLTTGSVEDLGADLSARAINDAREIVGTRECEDFPDDYCALLRRDGAWHDLNDLIPPDSGWELGGAYDINDAGEIVGSGYHDGFARAFLLIPEGELRSTGAIPGVAGRVNEIRVHGARPDARLLLFYSLREGSRSVPGCPGLSLSLDRPQPVVQRFERADENGDATFRAFVPSFAAGKTIILQAVDLDHCEVSRPVWHHFPDVE